MGLRLHLQVRKIFVNVIKEIFDFRLQKDIRGTTRDRFNRKAINQSNNIYSLQTIKYKYINIRRKKIAVIKRTSLYMFD